MPKKNIIEVIYNCTVEINQATKDLFDIKDAFPEGIVKYVHYKPMQSLYENAVLYRLGKELPGIEYTDKEFHKRVAALPPNIYSEATLEGHINDIPLEEFYGDKFQNKMADATKLIADTIDSAFNKQFGKTKVVFGEFSKT